MDDLKRKLHQEAQRRYREKNRDKINEERRGEKDKRAILRIESAIPSIEELRKIIPVRGCLIGKKEKYKNKQKRSI